MMEALVVTVLHEGLMSEIRIIARVEYDSEEDNLEARFRGAARAYAETEEGRIILAGIHGRFNWGDAFAEIPGELLRAWGIMKVEILAAEPADTLVLNHENRLL